MILVMGVSAGIGAGIGMVLSRIHCRVAGGPHTKSLQNKYTGLCIFLSITLASYIFSGHR